MRYLGIDFGLKHIGLALADGPLAEPWQEKNNNDNLYVVLKHLIETEKIDLVVIGLPEGRLAPAVKKFGQQLQKQIRQKIVYHDETLSTQEAKTKLVAAGVSRRKRFHDHQAAAALILQDYLDMIKEERDGNYV